jgi:predicted transcriptional regulator
VAVPPWDQAGQGWWLSLTPDASLDDAVQVMRDAAVRRMPVVEGDRPVGIVSIGDLAIREDPASALADISETPPNT